MKNFAASDAPEPAVADASEQSTTPTIEGLGELPERPKRTRYVHLEMNEEKTSKLLKDLDIQVEVSPTIPFVVTSDAGTAEPIPVEKYQWDHGTKPITDEEQRDRYMKYLEENIGDILEKQRLCVFGVGKESDILNVGLPGFNIDLVGRTDILILNDLVKEDPSDLAYLPDVKMLIEVKREIKENSVFQAMSELIALDVLSQDPVMALLTNLTTTWQFFWVSEKTNPDQVTINHATIDKPSEAFEIMRSLLSQSSSSTMEIDLPCLKVVKRRKLDEMVPAINASAGVSTIIQQYKDIASISGHDIDMARATAYQIVKNIPAFRKYA